MEVSTDGGKKWQDAELRTPAYRMAHTRFGLNWKWDGKECTLLSRCTDDLGQVQPTVAEAGKFFGDFVEAHNDAIAPASDPPVSCNPVR